MKVVSAFVDVMGPQRLIACGPLELYNKKCMLPLFLDTPFNQSVFSNAGLRLMFGVVLVYVMS